jgi:hypothetical protein
MALSRLQILASKPRTVSVNVPEWGGEVLLKPLTVGGLAHFMEVREKISSMQSFTLLLALSAVDENGKFLFDPNDHDTLKELPFDVVKRLGDEIMALNDLGEKAAPKADPGPSEPASMSLPNASE